MTRKPTSSNRSLLPRMKDLAPDWVSPPVTESFAKAGAASELKAKAVKEQPCKFFYQRSRRLRPPPIESRSIKSCRRERKQFSFWKTISACGTYRFGFSEILVTKLLK